MRNQIHIENELYKLYKKRIKKVLYMYHTGSILYHMKNDHKQFQGLYLCYQCCLSYIDSL